MFYFDRHLHMGWVCLDVHLTPKICARYPLCMAVTSTKLAPNKIMCICTKICACICVCWYVWYYPNIWYIYTLTELIMALPWPKYNFAETSIIIAHLILYDLMWQHTYQVKIYYILTHTTLCHILFTAVAVGNRVFCHLRWMPTSKATQGGRLRVHDKYYQSGTVLRCVNNGLVR